MEETIYCHQLRSLHVVKSTYSSETPVCNTNYESLSLWHTANKHTANKQTCLRTKDMKTYVEKGYGDTYSYSQLRLGHF